jgi:hypothetical protein
MNFRTTLILLLLVAAGAGLFWLVQKKPDWLPWTPPQPRSLPGGTLQVLEKDLTPEALSRIVIQRGDRKVVLERTSGEWTSPGKWPTRKLEVHSLVQVLTTLRSRYLPITLTDRTALKNFGLDRPELVVSVRTNGKDHRLLFGEEPGATSRFSRATYICLDDDPHRSPEVLRLAPGLVAALDRPPDFFQQRRLFPSERLAKDADSQEKVERLVAREIGVKGPGADYVVALLGDGFELRTPVRDHADPDKLKSILAAVPDIWVEQFVDKTDKDLSHYGLDKPEQTLRVTKSNGEVITLEIGKESQTKTRTITRPAPNMGGPPMPPQQETVHEQYRFAKLQGNDQVFEIKADKLKDIFVAGDTLRDARLARFRPEDVKRVAIGEAGQEIVLVKEKENWKLQKPMQCQADSSKVTELLDKLSGLQARDKDVLDNADVSAYGLDKPALKVRLTAEEEGKLSRAEKNKATKNFVLALGKHDVEKAKVYVRVEGRERINSVEDSVWKLVDRPAFAYRNRHILDVPSTEIAKLTVQRPGGGFSLKREQGSWRLDTPVDADVDSSKAAQLASDLGRLEVVEFVSESATPDALDHLYGLDRPPIRATLAFTDVKKPSQSILIGKQRPGKPEYFAKLASGSEVFVVKKEIRDALDQDALVLRPLQIWQGSPEEIKEIGIQREGIAYTLRLENDAWQIQGPFAARAVTDQVQAIRDDLANLRCERYQAHRARDLREYGLDKPYLQVSLPRKEVRSEEAGTKKKGPSSRTLLIGKPADKEGKSRFAKLASDDAVLVVGEKLVAALDHSALDFLEHRLLRLDTTKLKRIESASVAGRFALARRGDLWEVVDSPAASFPADSEATASVLSVLSNLQASKFAAYGPKADLAAYGLDKPSRTITLTLKSAPNTKSSNLAGHRLQLGKVVGTGDQFARLDDSPGVAVLPGAVAATLNHGYLDYVNRSVLKLERAKVSRIARHMGQQDLQIVKREDSWHLSKPADVLADEQTLEKLVTDLASLRAKRVAAYPAKDLKEFGLAQPDATVTVTEATETGKQTSHTVKFGRPVTSAQPTADRYAIIADSKAVVVLPGSLCRMLLAAPLGLRDRNLARIANLDRLVLERGLRRVAFARQDGAWKLVEPVQAEAEQTDLEGFLKELAHLRADELIAEKPADLKPYGIDRPVLRWRGYLGNQELLDLKVGTTEKVAQKSRQPRSYANLGGSDLVFLLSPDMSAKVSAEYRSRTLWPPLDAAQIDKLSFGYQHNPFVLEKVDNDWRLAGQSGSKVKPELIREVLDALSGLRAERFVVDKGADLKLYGLEPPQLVLDIHTSSGNRTLEVGRPEGESKRYYARVPSGERSGVFIVSEADSARIIQTSSTFAQDGTTLAR